ncbi:DUF378 domain-containing protein [Paraconexibacter sp.]|uniref:DUF378 domain-containing protein n=1 Tax=Paraconexibacter sp. TaxID=2949640 RepID=UPI003564834E
MMQSLAKLEPLWLGLVLAGALNWAMVGVFDTNVLAEIFGTGTFTDIVYTVVGFAALMLVPSLMDRLHLGDHGHGRAAHGH